MKKKLETFTSKLMLNWWPSIGRAGGKVIFLSEDYMHLKVRLKLGWKTRNIVGTIYGGSMYASTDPFFMLMLMKILGPDFVVWDKGCTIRFRKPAKETLFADFHITPEMLAEVHSKVAADGEATFTWTVKYTNSDGVVFAEFDKVIYIAQKSFYQEKTQK